MNGNCVGDFFMGTENEDKVMGLIYYSLIIFKLKILS
jgi:hypothetical protein